MALLSFFFFEQGYFFFAVLCPRVTHDVTAFFFYVVHDHNRHHPQARNSLYKTFNALKLPVVIVVPGIAIGLTFIMQSYGDYAFNQVAQFLFRVRVPKTITLGFIGYFSLLHYYTEAFTWKAKSPYRKFI